MRNLLQETIECMEIANKSVDDIFFIGTKEEDAACSWEEFKILADKEYDERSGGRPKVATDLVITFNDGSFLERVEYKGFELWNHHPRIQYPLSFVIESVFSLPGSDCCVLKGRGK